jgi:hypothetical protein
VYLIVRDFLPARWKQFIAILADVRDLLPSRLVHKIDRLNRRAVLSEVRGRS